MSSKGAVYSAGIVALETVVVVEDVGMRYSDSRLASLL